MLNENKNTDSTLNENIELIELSKYLIIDLNEDGNILQLIKLVVPRIDEERNSLIDRIADLIEEVDELVCEGFDFLEVIEKKIFKFDLSFKSVFHKNVFINSISKLFSN